MAGAVSDVGSSSRLIQAGWLSFALAIVSKCTRPALEYVVPVYVVMLWLKDHKEGERVSERQVSNRGCQTSC